jgi:hypothetical protein
MTDRELLEAAAKAAGVEIHESDDGTMQRRPVWAMTHYVQGQPYSETVWNPLGDDAQALRLAVKLRLTINCSYDDVALCGQEFTQKEVFLERNGEDPLAATRRAIVRAAAELGKEN